MTVYSAGEFHGVNWFIHETGGHVYSRLLFREANSHRINYQLTEWRMETQVI